jgi:hypothetical protein
MSKKSEVKGTELVAPVSAAVVAAEPIRPAQLAILKAGVKVPSAKDLADMESTLDAKRQALTMLMVDESLPEATRDALVVLSANASPSKPGMEEIEGRTEIPRISICQPTSQKATKPDAARGGDLYTDSGDLLVKPFQFIPVYFREEHVMFTPGSKAPECKAPDGKFGTPYGACASCAHLPFGKQNGGQGDQKPSQCFAQMVVTVMSMDLKNVYDLPLSKTSYSAGKALARLARAQPVPWQQSYLLDTEKKTGDKGLYYVAKVSPTTKNNAPDVLKVAQAFSDLLGAQRKVQMGGYYLAASSASVVAAAADQVYRGQIDLDGEPDVMPEGQSAVRSGKPM